MAALKFIYDLSKLWYQDRLYKISKFFQTLTLCKSFQATCALP